MRGIVKYLLLLFAGIMAASCVFDAARCDVPAAKPHNIMFTISMEGENTKARWDETYTSVDGVPFDYRILPDQLRVVVIANDGTRLGEIQDLYYWPENEAHTIYKFMGQMPDGFVDHYKANDNQPYKFIVLANCSDHQSGEQYITYSHTQLIEPSKDDKAAPSVGHAIPMWGVKEVNMKTIFENGTHNIGYISLLRAAAKIEVNLSANVRNNGTTINSATLKYYNQTGYVLPSGALEFSETGLLDQENCIRVYRHAAVNLPFVKDEKTGNYYVYVTEYDNTNYPGERNKISLEFNIGDEKKYFEDAISFCEYREGKPQENSHYNIVRNHIYQFEILSIAGDNLELQYTVADWDAERWDTDGDGELDSDYEEHELAYPTYHNPVVPASYFADDFSFEKVGKPKMQYSGNQANLETDAFECFFQITAPVREELWKPVFIGGTKENYMIRVYDHNGYLLYETGNKDKEKALGVCADHTEWFRILVFPLSVDGAGNDNIEFGITYYQMWTDQWINLYVNGEYDHIRWPESGDNPKVIKIKHFQAGAEQNVTENDE